MDPRTEFLTVPISEVKAVEYPYLDFDYAYFVTRKLLTSLDAEGQKLWNEFYSADKRKGIGFEPSPDELEEFLTKLGLMNEEVTGRLQDYRHFKATRTHRRPDVWKTRLE